MLVEVIKRDNSKVPFNAFCIRRAVMNANSEVIKEERASDEEIDDIIKYIKSIDDSCVHIETIQDIVEKKLMEYKHFDLAKKYITYRYIHNVARALNKTEKSVLDLIRGTNNLLMNENSNKDPYLNSTTRDLMAGEISKSISDKFLLPEEIVKAHEEGILHWHDKDYSVQPMMNCCLINIGDILDNGTVMNNLLIESPHTFRVACNIMTQVIATVASNQYGGQSVNIKHLGKYLALSRERLRIRFQKSFKEAGIDYTEEQLNHVVNQSLKKELEDGVQTIQYQINCLLTTNGQSPFLTLFLHIDETSPYADEVAMIIEEVIKQRLQGVKNKDGVYSTPAFPKLVYVLDENNNLTGGKYDYVTELCMKCNIKRMYPDYISAKMMRESHEGNIFSPMGCVDGKEVIVYKFLNNVYVESFERMWDRLSPYHNVLEQQEGNKDFLYFDTSNVYIYDTKVKDFVKTYRVIRNLSSDWVRLKFSNGRTLTCTSDHPLETENRGVVFARDLISSDTIKISKSTYSGGNIYYNRDEAWMLGLMLCDSSYYESINLSIAKEGEDDIQDKFISLINDSYYLSCDIINHERGHKGRYKDVRVRADNINHMKLRLKFMSMFEGIKKDSRHIPNEVFNWDRLGRLNFLAGMMDADGYVNSTIESCNFSRGQIGSVNKELALQQFYLIQSLDMYASIYLNHYDSRDKSKIRYIVEFDISEELASLLCNKKYDNFKEDGYHSNLSIKDTDICSLTGVEVLGTTMYSYDVTTESEHFEVSGIYSHNCRSFLGEWKVTEDFKNECNLPDEVGDYKYEGRFNQGVVSINLPQIGILANKDMDTFWQMLDERLSLCYKALLLRHHLLEGTTSDVSPIHWQFGAIARLKQGEKIDKLLHGNYSSISLGYIGIYETVQAMLGVSHTEEEGKEFALKIMNRLNDACERWKKDTNIGFSLYGTPAESLCYRFLEIDKAKFGVIENVTDHGFYTNSYHVFVGEDINAFDKFEFESQFQKISSGGAISYIEIPNLMKNEEALKEVIKFGYNHIQYFEFNSKSDYCYECGYEGEIILNENNRWQCPCCGNTNMKRMYVTRRTCGYLGVNDWNEGKKKEIKIRVLHL